MESRFGTDFGDVRLHTGSAARRSADELGARAYTRGSDVVIGRSGEDRHTLAHELSHVVQQRQGPVAGTDRGDGLLVSDPGDRFERAAEITARRVLSGPIPPTTADEESRGSRRAHVPHAGRSAADSVQPTSRAAALLALQRAAGNSAVARMMATARPAATVVANGHAGTSDVAVQRYRARNMGGVMDPVVVAHRRTAGGGFFSEANVGWIRIGTDTDTQPEHVERSVRPTRGQPGSGRHTEELLVEWARAQGANLGLAPDDASPALRVKDLYTERKPCTDADADADRKLRAGGNCHRYLTNTLHATVPVFYSVDGPAPHESMRLMYILASVRERHLRRVVQEGNHRKTNDNRQAINAVIEAARVDIGAIRRPWRPTDLGGYTAAVKKVADEKIAAILALAPPDDTVAADPASGSSAPLDPEGARPSNKRSATSVLPHTYKRAHATSAAGDTAS
jgi:hypothetical protein